MAQGRQPPFEVFNDVERHLLRATRDETSTPEWAAVAEDVGRLPSELPAALDPDEAPESGAELALLAQILGGQAAPLSSTSAPEGAGRAGYALVGVQHDAARAWPAFAHALATHDEFPALWEDFGDLWAVDLRLWRRLGSASAPELALEWLTSPGRRLLLDLHALPSVGTAERHGAADLSLKRVYEAVGVADAPEDPKGIRAWLDSGPPHWRACMAAIPGECTRGWRPATAPGQAVASALRDVERDTSPLVRCAALAWLLDRAVDAPHYVVGGLRRDLRDDLPPRLASAFAAGTHPRSPHAALEAVLLRHAAWLTRNDDESGAVLRTWAVARWLRGCLLRSPFFGGDAEALVARLLALLPVDVTVPADADPLHPGRFRLADGPDRNGLDLGDVAFVGAVAQHYRRQAGAYLKPTPVPVVDRLVALASRTLDPAEEAAETHLHTSDPATEATDGLGWGHRSLHVAPPLVARWLLSYLGVAWLHRAGEDAQRETLLRLGERPEAHEWATRAFHEEGPGLPPEVRAMGAATWRSLADAQTLRNRWLAMLAGGLLGDRGLDEAECLRAVGQAAAPDPDLGQDETDWRPFVLGSLAQRAEAAGMTRAWAEAVDRLLDLMEHTAETETCLNSALWALRRLARAGGPEALVRRTRFAELAADPPFSDHLGLRREMRRLRLLPDADRLRGTG